MIDRLTKLSTTLIAFLQSLALSLYIYLVGLIMINGNTWFGPMNKTPILGPMLFLTLFIFSALISAGIVLYIPFQTFWVKKNLKRAIEIVVKTILWLLLFFLFYVLLIVFTR